MTKSKAALVKELYHPFLPDEHEIRVGSTRNKAQWFVYVRREAITTRLDNLFPLDWSDEVINIAQHEKYATATIRLTISGVSRDNNGSQAGYNDNSEKGAVTDAFKRVASSFGVGLYLQSCPQIWTDGGFTDKDGKVVNWNAFRQQEKEAFEKFKAWYKSTFGGAPNDNSHQTDKPAVNNDNGNKAETWATPDNLKVFFDVWNKTAKLTDGEVCKLAGITTSDQWGTKYATGQAASEAVKAALQREADAAIEY